MRAVSNERGAVAITVALLMVVLVGFAALAIDVSALYQERRTLQNGADAAALAVAKDCAGPGCGASRVTANKYADLNADDGNSNVDMPCGTAPGLIACTDRPVVPADTVGYVQVTTSTYEVTSPGNPTEVNFNFAPVFDLVAPGDHEGRTMRATAVAAWGPPRSATTLPIALSFCEFDRLAGDLEPPFTESMVYFRTLPRSDTDCGFDPSGAYIPGGFGWLREGPDCELTIEVGDWVRGVTGARVPDCVDDDMTALQNKTVLVPIFDDTRGVGHGGEYRVFGFAAFHIVGYRFPGNAYNLGPCAPLGIGCMRGHFTGFSTTGTVFGGPNMGVNIIKLVG
jgi:Flp pilus assembly protein TadG